MPTMQDVAKKAGVSQSTVSRVLNYDDVNVSISEETIVKVLKAADELGYRIDALARAMKGKSTGVIGIVARRFDDFLPLLSGALADCFRKVGYTTIYGEAGNNPTETLRLHTLFETQFCDGLVLAADPRGLSKTQIRNMFTSKHLVMTAWGTAIPGIPLVNTNNRVGAALVMQHLLDLGHKRIAFLDVGWSGDSSVRRQVYVESMQAHKLPYKSYLLATNEGMQAGFEATQKLLALDPPPTAIFAAEDLLALGALKAAQRLGIPVPKKLSVVGFDDLPFADFSLPSLTTVRQPIQQIAEQVCELLVGLISEELEITPSNEVTLIDPTLVVRESTAPVGGKE